MKKFEGFLTLGGSRTLLGIVGVFYCTVNHLY